MVKLNQIEKLSMELAQLIAAEQKALQQIEDIRRKRAKVLRDLVASSSTSKVAAKRAASSTKTVRSARQEQHASKEPRERSVISRVIEQVRATAATDSEKVRAYVESVTAGEIRPEQVAAATGVKSSLVSTYLSRLTGTLLERVPGTKRGRYRRIVPASSGGESTA
jgi:uncharacterized protein (DUF2267 family)